MCMKPRITDTEHRMINLDRIPALCYKRSRDTRGGKGLLGPLPPSCYNEKIMNHPITEISQPVDPPLPLISPELHYIRHFSHKPSSN